MSELQWLTHSDFASRVGDQFEVDSAGGPVTVELVEATEGTEPGGDGPKGEKRQQFSLLFEGPGTPALDQSIHQLRHADLGELDLFLVPIGPRGDGMGYEAAFA